MTDNYSQDPYVSQYPVQKTSVAAIISLISAILSWVGVFGLGGLVAVIAGHIAKNEIHAARGEVSGDGMATAGLILGYLNLALTAVGICMFILVLLGVFAFSIPWINTGN